MSRRGGGDGMERTEGGAGEENSSAAAAAFTQWATTIIQEFDATVDSLKDEGAIVKVRRMQSNSADILTNAEQKRKRPDVVVVGRRMRENVVIGLDDAIVKAIKNLQKLRTNLKEESKQLFNLAVVGNNNWMDDDDDVAHQSQSHTTRTPTTSIDSSAKPNTRSATARKISSSGSVGVDNNKKEGGGGGREGGNSCGGGGGGVEVKKAIPPPPTATSASASSAPKPVARCSANSSREISKRIKRRDIIGCHHLSAIPPPPPREAKEPGDILPPECWMLVFDKVEDPQDWLSLYQTSSSYFQGVVGDKRTTALFPLVFPLVFKYPEDALDEFLEVRKVSRGWKAGVDKMLEEGSVSSLNTNQQHDADDELEQAYTFENSDRMSSFLEHFGTHPGNPFVRRFASFKFNYDVSSDVIAEYCLLATRLLDKFGAQLKTLHVELLATNLDNCASRLRSVLQLTPNLDSLNVHFDNIVDRYGRGAAGEGEVVMPYIEKRPLPLLRNLKSLWITGEVDEDGLLDLKNVVVGLSCSRSSLQSVKTIGVPSGLLPFPNVKSAVVRLKGLGDYFDLAKASWPLSTLILSTDLYGAVQFLFNNIGRFKATLTSLHFERPLSDSRDASLKLDLPHLKQLTMVKASEQSLGFLRILSNLQVLTILSNHTMHPNAQQRAETNHLQTFLEWARPEVSRWRLWEGLPKLAEIRLIGPVVKKRNGDFMFEMRHLASRSSGGGGGREFQRQANQLHPTQIHFG